MDTVYVPEFLTDLANVRLAMLDAGDIAGAAACLSAYDAIVKQWNDGDAFDELRVGITYRASR